MQIQKDKIKDFLQRCKDEYQEYLKDEEAFLDKYAKLSISNLHLISIGFFLTLILLQSPFNFYLVSNFIALSFLVLFISIILIVRYTIKYNQKEIKLEICESWIKTIFVGILINFLLLVFKNGFNQMLVILFFLTIAMIYILNKKRSL